MKNSIQKIIIVFENLEYGGMTTFIENNIGSSKILPLKDKITSLKIQYNKIGQIIYKR